MKKMTLSALSAFLMTLTVGQKTAAQDLLHYWNFNNPSSAATITQPSYTIVSAPSITVFDGTQSVLNFAGGTGQNFDVQNLNAQNNDPAGTHLRFNNPIDGSLTFHLPTTGYENVEVKFATRRSGSGAGTQTWSYSTDGIVFVPFQVVLPNDGPPTLQTLNFSSLPTTDNNPDFKLKVEFSAENGGAVGNNRFDNFTMHGYPHGSGQGEGGASLTAQVSFAQSFYTVNEQDESIDVVINVTNPTNGTINLVAQGAPFSTADASDYTFTSQTITLPPNSASTYTVTIPIIDDELPEQQAEYFVLSLENPQNISVVGDAFTTVYIKDNDRVAKTPTQELSLQYVGSFDPSGNQTSSTEIVAYDAGSKRLFATSAIAGYLDIIDFQDPTSPSTIGSINMNTYGGVTSVAVHNGLVAVASPNANEVLDGSVVFFDTEGTFLKQVTVGALPDNISFTPDGTHVLTANEGQPNANYTIDPEGSVSIIDVSVGIDQLTQAQVTTLLFTQFNAQEAALLASGIRKTKSTSTLSQDLEPEYITVSSDSQKAWVTLQENNAIAEIDLVNKNYTSIWGLGTKDMSAVGNGFDASDTNNEILIANWPVKAYYSPDAIAHFSVNGTPYLITANEGDEKEYIGFVERTEVKSTNYVLDPEAYPQAEFLKKDHNLGRFRTTNLDGQKAEGSYNQIYALGARSFSIFNANTKELVFDSGDDFEMYTSTHYPTIFNSDHENNTPKKRSRAKGPEPEGVTVAVINGQTYAFVVLERIGGVMVYNVTDPNAPVFVDYKNSRSTSSYAGDHGAEAVIYIPSDQSPNGKGILVISNEISGTLTIYEIPQDTASSQDFIETLPFSVFPNPATSGLVYFNRPATVEVYQMNGKLIFKGADVTTLNTSSYAAGMYLIKTSEGIVKKLIVK